MENEITHPTRPLPGRSGWRARQSNASRDVVTVSKKPYLPARSLADQLRESQEAGKLPRRVASASPRGRDNQPVPVRWDPADPRIVRSSPPTARSAGRASLLASRELQRDRDVLTTRLAKTPDVIRAARWPTLTEADIRLALLWADSAVITENRLESSTLDDVSSAIPVEDSAYWEIERCLSARRAELHVASIRRAMGQTVEDISRLQLSKPTDRRWMVADLIADGVLVDVKNSRFDSEERQTWHYVKSFKRDERNRQVEYDGTRSRKRRVDSYSAPDRSDDVVYLGTTTADRLSRLQSFSNRRLIIGGDAFLTTSEHLPNWCFELPESTYLAHKAAAEELWQMRLANHSVIPVPKREIALFASFGLDTRAFGPALESTINRIADAIAAHGRWPALMIIELLNRFIEELSGSVDPKMSDAEDLFFPSRAMPLAVFDPTQSVYAFYDVLKTLLRKDRNVLSGITALRLVGPQWLDGIKENGSAVPILVYCGRCGNHPLVRGVTAFCSHGAERLRCECGWCPCDEGDLATLV